MLLTNDSSITSSFFTSIFPRYTSAGDRMFFGLSSFNFSASGIKKFGIDTSNFANLYSTYTYANSIYGIKLPYFFFVERSCAAGLYFYYNYANPALEDCVATCSGKSDRLNIFATINFISLL